MGYELPQQLHIGYLDYNGFFYTFFCRILTEIICSLTQT